MNKLKKSIPYIINIIIVLSIFLLALKINHIYPFGKKSIAVYDSYYQYQPMLYNFITKIQNGQISTYTFNNGLGTPTIFNFLYYLASPINVIALLFKNPNSMFIAVILTKIIITSLTTTFYLKRKTNSNFISTIGTIGYIYSAWFVAYHYTIMWLDAFMVFPLFQYGLEELIEKKKATIYIFTLAYIMISNFYMAFLICCYTLIYYLVNIIIKKDKYINKIKNFDLIMFSSIVTFLLAFLFIYATYDTFLTMGININQAKMGLLKMIPLDMIKTFFYGNQMINTTLYGNTFPNIATNTIFLISFIYYFINPQITKKQKITTFVCICFTIFCFYNDTANYLLNCFHIPIGYHFRYSFIFTFYIIIIFIRNFKTFSNKIDTKIYGINILLLGTIIFLYYKESISFNQCIFNIVFISCYTILFRFYNKSKSYKYLFTTIIILETILYTTTAFQPTFPTIEEYENKITINQKRQIITEQENPYTINLYENKSTINSFSSMQYNRLFPLFDALSIYNDGKAMILYNKNTYITEMLLNTGKEYPLEKIYSVKKEAQNTLLPFFYNIDFQNTYMENMTGIENILEKEILQKPKKTQEKEYIYTFKEDNRYTIDIQENMDYIFFQDTLYILGDNSFPIKYKNATIITTEDLKDNITIDAQNQEQIIIKYKDTKENTTLEVYKPNKEKLKKAYQYLKEGEIKYTKYTEDTLEGTITVKKNQFIYTSIPYDEHWQIEIDGQKVTPIILLDSLIGIECKEGTHTITMKYKNNFTIPGLVSLLSLTTIIIYTIYTKRKVN